MPAPMLRLRFLFPLMLLAACACRQPVVPLPDLPDSFSVKTVQQSHVQGIALDVEGRCFYVSFTTCLQKVDFEGNVLASVDTLYGHLGAMVFDPEARRLYASLECKDDEIGLGVAAKLGVEAYGREESRFYIACFDVDALTGPGTPADRVLELRLVEEATADYGTRYGCAGIDGVAIAPRIGRRPGKPCLYVAYGIYGDTTRTDNDNQILLEYELPVPEHASAKYFVRTGNTTYGVQNMTYDPADGNLYLAVYRGRKRQFPNHTLFAVPVRQRPRTEVPAGLGEPQAVLRLAGADGAPDGISGWEFADASTGICAVGDGSWYNAVPEPVPGGQTCRIRRITLNDIISAADEKD